jgi:hypothetical protein
LLATLLDPEEHPASIPASTNMRKSRRIFTTPLCGRFASRTITWHRNAAPAIGTGPGRSLRADPQARLMPEHVRLSMQ